MWKRPKTRVLTERVYKIGTPNFYPFPIVTDVLSAAHCPIAAIHTILHGRDNPLTEGEYRVRRIGDLFHDFIAHLKNIVLRGRRFSDSPQIRYEFENFARRETEEDRSSAWQYYIQPWCRRKLEELSSLQSDTNLFFEVHVANARVPFRLMGGQRTYPLMGKIDEVNISDRKLIERTSMGNPNDTSPPRLKDYQIWLLWRTLCSMNEDMLPEGWRNVDFRNFDLLVETPYKDFVVHKDQPNFEERTQIAYAWIHDIFFERRAYHEANSGRSCTYLNQIEDCGFRWPCYGARRRRPFRAARDEMRREFRNFYSLLAHDLLWSQHLFRYQLTMLNRQMLEQLGLMTSARVLSFEDGRLEMELGENQMERFLAQRESGEIGGYYIVFGTFHSGVRLVGFVENLEGNRVTMSVSRARIPTTAIALLIENDPEATAYTEEPWFLTRRLQSSLFSLESWGLDREDRAQANPTIRMLEAIFGTGLLRGG
jgi:hypothetical protein